MKAAETLIILQARMSSSRLPNKVLMPILGKAMLAHQLARLTQLKTPHQLIVATSDHSSDDAIEDLCNRLNTNCFRGSLDDVLARYYHAAQAYNQNKKLKTIVRLTGDCPVIDSDIIDKVIALYCSAEVDYCSNCNPATLPDGLDVEVFSYTALEQAYRQAKKPAEREHVTLFIHNNPTLFASKNYLHDIDLSHFRWTVDEPSDFELITKIYQALYNENNFFSLHDIVKLMTEQPQLAQINHQIKRNEGLLKAELADKNKGISS